MKDLVPASWKSGVNDLRDRMMRVFDEWLPETWTGGHGESTLSPATFWQSLTGPAVDIVDRAEEVLVKAELPGLDKGDFTIEVESDRLILRGEKKAEKEQKEGTCLIREARYGSFYRAILLPATVDRDKADATYKHGVLTVTLPKTADSKSRRVAVKVS